MTFEDNLQKKYEACMVLAALGDIIGYNNGKYEFNQISTSSVESSNKSFDYSDFLVFHFIYNDGFIKYPTPDMIWSDDTIFHVSLAKALISKYSKSKKDILDKMEKNMIKLIDTPEKLQNLIELYTIGNQTLISLKSIAEGTDWRTFPYSSKAGGSGGTMRSMCIGLAYNGLNKRQNLIEMSIDSCKITHNNTIAYLGSLACALFIALAIEKKDPKTWVFDLISLLESNIIDDYIQKTYPNDFDNYKNDKLVFLEKWQNYVQYRFNKFQFIEKPNMMIPSYRSYIYHERFSSRKKDIYPGAGGDDSVIIAYDAFLDAKDSWNKLIVYSMLHVGDSDTTGTIAGGFYGAYYGFNNVSKVMLQNFRQFDEIKDYGKQLYKLFYNV